MSLLGWPWIASRPSVSSASVFPMPESSVTSGACSSVFDCGAGKEVVVGRNPELGLVEEARCELCLVSSGLALYDEARYSPVFLYNLAVVGECVHLLCAKV